MKERPILFSAPMVRAILAGTKTQTRRVVKQQITPLGDGSTWHQFDHCGSNYRMNLRNGTASKWSSLLQFCPYGQPGDRLWVRETFCHQWNDLTGYQDDKFWYRASTPDVDHVDGDGKSPWKPSIHMPRWASRITLEITSVRVERLRDITISDAMAEGYDGSYPSPIDPSIQWYADLWESINGHGSWTANPWVWVVEFKRVEGEAA